MTVMDKVNAGTHMVSQMLFDQEQLNYLEVAALYAIVAQGRYNVASLEIALALANMAKASQVTLLAAMHQSYQPHVSAMLRRLLDEGLD